MFPVCAYYVQIIAPWKNWPTNRYFFYLYPVESIIIAACLFAFVKLFKTTKFKTGKRLIGLVLVIIILADNNFQFGIRKSWFVNEGANGTEAFKQYLKDAHVIHVSPESYRFNELAGLYPWFKELFSLTYPVTVNYNGSIDYRDLIIRQIKLHIPYAEKIVLLKDSNIAGDLFNDPAFLDSLEKIGYGLTAEANSIGLYFLCDVFLVIPLTDERLSYPYLLRNTTDVYKYLDLLGRADARYSILFGVRGGGAAPPDDELNGRLRDLGLQKGLLTRQGILPDGTPFSISGSADYPEPGCGIEINGLDYAVNWRGINIAVYDNAAHKVVDSVAFDTYDGGHGAFR